MDKLKCTRDENPDTCSLCQIDDKSYCDICPDDCTDEELTTIEHEYQKYVHRQIRNIKRDYH